MRAEYIATHEIINRHTLKILPVEGRTALFIVKRMYDSYASANAQNTEITDIELGVLAKIIDIKKEPGTWHDINLVNFVKPRYEVEPFYDELCLAK